jgi:lambda family phage minor tail protein L
MPIVSVNAESDVFNPSALLSLYTIDTRFVSVTGSLYRFHAGVNGLYKELVFNGITYTPFPIELSNKDINGQGSLPRPRLRGSNINGFLSQFLRTQGDMVGGKLTITRVYARFIDAVNFANDTNPFGTPDPTAAYEDDIWFIGRKVTENPEFVEFEMNTPFELENVQLPRGKMLATICPLIYRDGETCGYSGPPITDRYGKSFTDAAPSGYGYTLNARGAWAAGNTYAVGDWVIIISEGDLTFGDVLVYVCSTAATTGSFNNPQFNSTNWVADGCLHNLLGCDTHFDSPLPFGGKPGISRASYI